MRSTEHERIAGLRALFGEPPPGSLGIGDDCALFRADGPVAVSVDTSVEGVHFRRAWMSLTEVGYRATMAALSDLAAMGAEPLGVLGSLVLPAAFLDTELFELAGGQRAAATEVGTRIVGGNLARGSELSITTTVFGRVERPVQRRGARPGDDVFVCGRLGAAAAGLAWFVGERRPGGPAWESARHAFVRPRALIQEGLGIAARGATSMIDVSDGLAADAGHLARASEVGLVLSRDALEPFFGALPAAEGFDPVTAVLAGGEDYALLFTQSPGVPCGGDSTRIGRVVESPQGVWLESAGVIEELVGGFDHFNAARR